MRLVSSVAVFLLSCDRNCLRTRRLSVAALVSVWRPAEAARAVYWVPACLAGPPQSVVALPLLPPAERAPVPAAEQADRTQRPYRPSSRAQHPVPLEPPSYPGRNSVTRRTPGN